LTSRKMASSRAMRSLLAHPLILARNALPEFAKTRQRSRNACERAAGPWNRFRPRRRLRPSDLCQMVYAARDQRTRASAHRSRFRRRPHGALHPHLLLVGVAARAGGAGDRNKGAAATPLPKTSGPRADFSQAFPVGASGNALTLGPLFMRTRSASERLCASLEAPPPAESSASARGCQSVCRDRREQVGHCDALTDVDVLRFVDEAGVSAKGRTFVLRASPPPSASGASVQELPRGRRPGAHLRPRARL
jgi:hypothetical protein